MARDVNDIVVLGLGNWSDVNGLPTLGFGIGVVVAVTHGPPGLQYIDHDNRLHYTADDNRLHYTADDERMHYHGDG